MAQTFGIKIDYRTGRNNPEKIFEAMAMYISAYEDLIQLISNALGQKETFTFSLNDVEKGSLITYLNGFKEKSTNFIASKILDSVGETTRDLSGIIDIQNENDIDKISTKIDGCLKEKFTGKSEIVFPEVDKKALSKILKKLSDANQKIRKDETVGIILDDISKSKVDVNTNMRFSANNDDLYVEGKIIKDGLTDRLFIVKPVNDGNSRWDCKSLHMKQRFEASMADKKWLERYQGGLITPIGPSDIMLAKLNFIIKSSKDNKASKIIHAEIIEVIDILKNRDELSNESFNF